MVICGCLLVVCGCLLVVCGCLLVVCGRLLLFGGGLWSLSVLVTMGVSVSNVAKIVDIVLTQIAGIQVDQLPKSAFAKDVAIESWEWRNTRLPQSCHHGVLPI